MAALQSESGFENGQCELDKWINFIEHYFASDGQKLVEQHSWCGWIWLVVTEANLWSALNLLDAKKTFGEDCAQTKMRTSCSATQMLCELCMLRC
jgi:hypothetical protein